MLLAASLLTKPGEATRQSFVASWPIWQSPGPAESPELLGAFAVLPEQGASFSSPSATIFLLQPWRKPWGQRGVDGM